MAELLDVLNKALDTGGDVLMQYYGNRSLEIVNKSGSAIDLVTVADKTAEDAINRIILETYGDHQILGEESGLTGKVPASGYKWLVDPLDGTTNFAHGVPLFSVSIAVEKDGELVAAGVFNPYIKEKFLAEKGGGATFNGDKIRVSEKSRLSEALLISGFPYDRRERMAHYLKAWDLMLMKGQGMLRLGSAAIDLCYVACGRVEGYWEENLQPWDTAAGTLIVREAGGRVSDFEGKEFGIYDRRLFASNGVVHEECLAVLRERSEWIARNS